MKVSGWQNVRALMLKGWQLSLHSGIDAEWALHKDAQIKYVHAATVWKMRKENRIKIATKTEDTPWYRTDYVLNK